MKLQKFNRTLVNALLISGAMGVASQAHAAQAAPTTPGYCLGGTATEGIAVGNVTLNSMIADDCYGVVGDNINSAADMNGLNLTWGSNWVYLDSNSASSATWMGLKFTVTAPTTTDGNWTLTGEDKNGTLPLSFPVDLDFAVALKAGNEYALWGFDNVSVDGTNGGTFTIVFKNNGDQIPNLSHMTVFGREAGGGTIATIPEADTYAMLLAGLGLVGFAARRKLSKTV